MQRTLRQRSALASAAILALAAILAVLAVILALASAARLSNLAHDIRHPFGGVANEDVVLVNNVFFCIFA